ncbi:unnamed protein product [Lactuca saligna]|uniref:Uncharacterized protein n=1 Tax=Lactuca saligna TaxID=75948 RepID=A0AA35V3N5_LACSI|nr:unnamed protein product [Lactuca saligna]
MNLPSPPMLQSIGPEEDGSHWSSPRVSAPLLVTSQPSPKIEALPVSRSPANWKDMDAYYNSYWVNTLAGLKREYFNNPWSIIALFAAFLLFALQSFKPSSLSIPIKPLILTIVSTTDAPTILIKLKNATPCVGMAKTRSMTRNQIHDSIRKRLVRVTSFDQRPYGLIHPAQMAKDGRRKKIEKRLGIGLGELA